MQAPLSLLPGVPGRTRGGCSGKLPVQPQVVLPTIVALHDPAANEDDLAHAYSDEAKAARNSGPPHTDVGAALLLADHTTNA
eukprot:gene298-1629_t